MLKKVEKERVGVRSALRTADKVRDNAMISERYFADQGEQTEHNFH